MESNKDSKELALHYMATLVDVARESIIILDHDLRVISANPVFYNNFKVSPEQTVNKILFDLGNGQWDIPELRKLLKEILPDKKSVRDYQVTHVFEAIGRKTMQLNARQIDSVQLIIIAIEDVSYREEFQKQLIEYTEGLEAKVAERTAELAAKVEELESSNRTMVGRELKMIELKKEIEELKKNR